MTTGSMAALVAAATELLDRRAGPGAPGVAAALLLADGRVLTGIPLDNLHASMNLCAETGPMCQAHTDGVAVVASACVARDDDAPEVFVYAPCGACQERLSLWGPEVVVAVADPGTPEGWSARRLIELQPHYWAARYADGDGPWPSTAAHETA